MLKAGIWKSGYQEVEYQVNRVSGQRNQEISNKSKILLKIRINRCKSVSDKIQFEKTKPISQPSAGNPKHEALNSKQAEGRVYLKKQSQYTGRHIDLNSYLKGGYGYVAASGARKNKANLLVLSAAYCVLRNRS